MPSLAACRCPFRLMRRCFLGRWNCLLVSEGFCLVRWCRLFDYNTCGNIINCNDDFNNERTPICKKYIWHTLFSKGWCFLCLRGEWRQGQTAILTQVLLTTLAALLPHLGWGWSTVGHWGPKALCLPLALTSASCFQLTRTVWAPDYIIISHPPASAVLPLFYTDASLDWRLSRGKQYH